MTRNINVARVMVRDLRPEDKTTLGNELLEGISGPLHTSLIVQLEKAIETAELLGDNSVINRLEALLNDVERG